jgi:hypothetical protein
LFKLYFDLDESVPKIVHLRPHNVTILTKGDAIFECSVLSYPSAQITWKKNSKKINDNNKKFKIIYGSNLSYLRITDASHSPTLLNITCHAENYRGYTESIAFLNILAGKFPSFTA